MGSENVSRSALAPRPSCFLSHPRSLLPLQAWAGGTGAAAGSWESLSPNSCHPSAWQGTTPGQRETKSCETNIFNAVTAHDAVRLWCQEAWYLIASQYLVPCWRAKYLNGSEMSPSLTPFWAGRCCQLPLPILSSPPDVVQRGHCSSTPKREESCQKYKRGL